MNTVFIFFKIIYNYIGVDTMAKRIYLLSGADDLLHLPFNNEVREMLKNDLKGAQNLVSIGAKREYEKNDIYFNGNEKSLGTLKTFQFSDLKYFNLIDGRTSKEDGLKLLEQADIIYLQGGDPFVQLEYIKSNKYDIFLKNYKGIILGLSAGTMNLGNIGFYSKDEDYPQTIFYEALGLTDLTIDPHFDINDDERVKEALQGSLKHKIIGLPDYSALVVSDNDVIDYFGANYVFENGKKIENNIKIK